MKLYISWETVYFHVKIHRFAGENREIKQNLATLRIYNEHNIKR